MGKVEERYAAVILDANVVIAALIREQGHSARNRASQANMQAIIYLHLLSYSSAVFMHSYIHDHKNLVKYNIIMMIG